VAKITSRWAPLLEQAGRLANELGKGMPHWRAWQRHNARLMLRCKFASVTCLAAILLAGCATRSVDVKPLPASPADFAGWSCTRIDNELDLVQQRATDVAYSVDERAGNNILALGLGVTVFWPAILAMRPDGLEAADLARLKGRDEALRVAAAAQGCPPVGVQLAASRAAGLPVGLGDRLVYEERHNLRQPLTESTLRLTALRRNELQFVLESKTGPGELWQQDLAGNVTTAPAGSLQWPHLLRSELVLGQVIAGDIVIAGDPLARARMRGQVVAVGSQTVADRRFDVAVIELFGDATAGENFTRVDGAIAVDRQSGVLLRLDLRCAQPVFNLQRRLARVLPAAP